MHALESVVGANSMDPEIDYFEPFSHCSHKDPRYEFNSPVQNYRWKKEKGQSLSIMNCEETVKSKKVWEG